MSDFTTNLDAAVERNNAIIDEYNNRGRELRSGDHVIGPDESAPPVKQVVDSVEDNLEDHGLVLDDKGRKTVENHVRHLNQTSNGRVDVHGPRREEKPDPARGKLMGRAREYEMSCRARIRNETRGDGVAVQQSWNASGAAEQSKSATEGRETARDLGGSVDLGPVNVKAGGSDKRSQSTTQGSGNRSGTSVSSGTQVHGERREGDVFLRCEVTSTYRDTFRGLPVESGTESYSFDVDVGKHSIIRAE